MHLHNLKSKRLGSDTSIVDWKAEMPFKGQYLANVEEKEIKTCYSGLSTAR